MLNILVTLKFKITIAKYFCYFEYQNDYGFNQDSYGFLYGLEWLWFLIKMAMVFNQDAYGF